MSAERAEDDGLFGLLAVPQKCRGDLSHARHMEQRDSRISHQRHHVQPLPSMDQAGILTSLARSDRFSIAQ